MADADLVPADAADLNDGAGLGNDRGPVDELPDGVDEAEPEVSSPDLVFTTAKKDRADSEVGESLIFKIDGEFYEATRPKDDAFVFLTTAGARSTPMPERMAAIISFISHALTEESGIRVRDRLLDRDDDFSFEELLEIMTRIVKHWTKDKRSRRASGRAGSRARR